MTRRTDKAEGPAPDDGPLPDLRQLHERHPGLTPEVCSSFAQAAEVALSRHGEPPCEVVVRSKGAPRKRPLNWLTPDERARRAWANRDDTTRDGAYSVSLAAVETELGLVAVSRADIKTGADYFIAPAGAPDLEDADRLEVSGVNEGARAAVQARVRQKLEQAAAGQSDRRAVVSVVGFKERVVVLERLDDPSAGGESDS